MPHHPEMRPAFALERLLWYVLSNLVWPLKDGIKNEIVFNKKERFWAFINFIHHVISGLWGTCEKFAKFSCKST